MSTETAVEPQKLLIGGEWTNAASGNTFETINPSTGEILTRIAEGGADDMDRAVQAARTAFDGEWAKTAAADRGRMLWKLAQLIRENAKEIAELETLDNGKPIFESLYVDIPSTAACFEYYAGWATKITGETIPINANAFNFTLRQPAGVVGAIVPWNFPLLLAGWKMAPALAAGCTIVVKPARYTSLSLLKVGQLVEQAGIPAGVVNIVPGKGSVAGTALATHPGIDKVAFTGSTSVGKGLLKQTAETLKRVTVELGGKSPNIVFEDADLKSAVRGATMGIFYGKGEVCAAGSRLLVQKPIYDEFVARVVAKTEKTVPADPMHPKTRFGALVSQEQLDTVLEYVEAGKNEGAALQCGGERVDVHGNGTGCFVSPAVFSHVKNDMRIAQEEIFGPVLAVIPFEDEDEAIALANDNPYGLAAGVWTHDIKRGHRVARKIDSGTVWVNTYNMYDAALPFGGFKESGFGRELGSAALESYTEVKSVWMDLS